MTAALVVSNAAREDTRRILEYLEEHAGVQVSLRYAIDFDVAIDRIAALPHSGSPRRQYGDDVRAVIVDPYLIFYVTTSRGDRVEVLRILHGSRNITEDLVRGEGECALAGLASAAPELMSMTGNADE